MKLKYTKMQKIVELLTIFLIISMILYLMFRWDSIPDKIPGHYNFEGVVDRWGNKGELISLPAFSVFLYGLLSIVTIFPSMWNLPIQVNDQNREVVAKTVRSMLNYMKLEIVILFFYILICASNAITLGIWFLPVVLIVLFSTMFYYLRKMKKFNRE